MISGPEKVMRIRALEDEARALFAQSVELTTAEYVSAGLTQHDIPPGEICASGLKLRAQAAVLRAEAKRLQDGTAPAAEAAVEIPPAPSIPPEAQAKIDALILSLMVGGATPAAPAPAGQAMDSAAIAEEARKVEQDRAVARIAGNPGLLASLTADRHAREAEAEAMEAEASAADLASEADAALAAKAKIAAEAPSEEDDLVARILAA